MKNNFLLTKKITAAAIVALASASLFAEHAPVYISPNNDGIQDVLEVPILVKEKRYVMEWSFFIYDKDKVPVRVISNKEKRPDRLTFRSFWSSLFKTKKGVDIPKSVTWNGTLDDGSIAPDGLYYYAFEATDDNGNSSKTALLEVFVDNTHPEVKLEDLSDDQKIFGEGNKSVFTVKQSGSQEDLWSAKIVDSMGKTVWQRKWESADGKAEPITFDWDGSGVDENGMITGLVPDGVYSYEITSTDRAGNKSAEAKISNIIYSSVKPATNIAINGSRYFSPGTNSKQKEISFDVSIPAPDGKINKGAKLIAWSISVVDQNNKEVRKFEGTDKAPSSIIFDGKNVKLSPAVNVIGNNNSSYIPDGTYQAIVNAKYQNGYETVPVNSPSFIKDTNLPTATIKSSNKIFSPDGDGVLDIITFDETFNKEATWTGNILSSDGKVVRSYELGQTPESSLTWDGIDSEGKLAPDGYYTYEIAAIDLAGNESKVKSEAFHLDTSKTVLILSASPSVFSPVGKSNHNVLTLTPVEKTNSIVSYELVIKDSANNIVKTFAKESALPPSILWNGYDENNQLCPDGSYTAQLSTIAENGSRASAASKPFAIDTNPPEVTLTAPELLVFSPDGDGNLDDFTILATSSSENKWTGVIQNSSGNIVKSYEWKGTVPESITWDGRDESGNIVADGIYSFTVSAEDEAGNSTSATISNITSDTREAKAYVTAALSAISPNGDGVKDEQTFNIRTSLTDGIASWKFSIVDSNGKTVKEWSEKDQKDLPQTITWDGKDISGKAVEGILSGNLDLVYVKGNKISASTATFVSTATAPVISVRTLPDYFSPDNDGENDDLFIMLKCESLVSIDNWSFVISDPESKKPFWTTSGKSSITERITWDGRSNKGELVQSATDYPYVFTVTDSLGMTSKYEGVIQVDVLVIRDGNKLKMQVPSIIFRGNHADFKSVAEVLAGPVADRANKGLDQKTIDNNVRVLKRIAQILKKFKDYSVSIEGNANNLSGTVREETEVQQLSEERAKFVLDWLVEKGGISASRLSAQGNGSKDPVVNPKDVDNRWKNRRVEFTLVK